MTPIETKCHNNEKCPKRDACARRSDLRDEQQIYASHFVAGAECVVYQPVEAV